MVNRTNLEERLDCVISPVMNDKTPGMALLIAQGDEVLVRKGYGLADMTTGRKISPDDNLIIASNTKQFTCMAVLMLVEAGLLKLDDRVEKFFPDFPDDVKKVTIWEMMVHQSGIKEYFEEDRWQATATTTTDEMMVIVTFLTVTPLSE